MNLDQARFFMVEQQIRPWDVLDPQILELLEKLPRHKFVAAEQEKLAYTDVQLPLADGEVMLEPKVEARLLQAIDLDSDDTALIIGTGSGYLTALAAEVSKEVTSVEISSTLLNQAKERLASYNNIQLIEGDAGKAWADNKTYDAIILTGSVPSVPQSYKEQLNLGGRIFAIVGEGPAMEATLLTRISDDEWLTEVLFETNVAPLKNIDKPSGFSL